MVSTRARCQLGPERTPVVVHRGGGAIAETGVESGGGLGYETDSEMLVALKKRKASERKELFEDGLVTQLVKEGKIKKYPEVIQRLGSSYRS